MVLFEERAVLGANLHGSGGTGRDAQLTNTASGLIVIDTHLRPDDMQRPRGAHCRAGPTVDAFLDFTLDFLVGILDLDVIGFQVLNAFLEVLLGAGQFQDHNAFLAREHSGVENVERQVVILGEITDDRLFHLGSGKAQDEYF